MGQAGSQPAGATAAPALAAADRRRERAHRQAEVRRRPEVHRRRPVAAVEPFPGRRRPAAVAAAAAAADSDGEGDKRVLVTGVRKQKIEIPADAAIYRFKAASGPGRRSACWRLGVHGADTFASTSSLVDAETRFTRSTSVKIYFPTFTRYFIVKTFRDAHGFTLLKLLRHIHTTATMAVAHYLQHEEGRTKITRRDVNALLKRYAVCSLRIKSGKVFVVTTEA
jgi:hypothetical protein